MSDLHHINEARTRNQPVRRWWRDNWKVVIFVCAILGGIAGFMVHTAAHDCAFTHDRLTFEDCQ